MTGTFDLAYPVSTMTMQLTFHRGHDTGHWVEDSAEYIKEVTDFPPPDGSGSLKILFKGEAEIVLVDKAEHTAQKVFDNYCEPDWDQMAEAILGAYQKGDTPFSAGLTAVADNPRHIEHDAFVVRGILKDLLVEGGYDPREFREFDDE